MNELIQFVPEELLILIPSVYVIGAVLKGSEFVKDKYINLLLTLIAIIASIGLQGFGVRAILQGIICAGVATLFNQTIKQLDKKE